MRNIRLITGLPFNLAPIEDITDQLPKNPNYSWEQKCGIRKLEALTDIAIHHTAELKAKNIVPATHANNHIRSTKNHPLGDPGFPYHLIIKNGRIYQGNNLLTFIYGVASNNYQTVHITVEGRYDAGYDILSQEDRNALYGAILTVKSLLPNYQRIKGHNEYDRTLCPGFNMDQVRKDIASIEEAVQAVNDPKSRIEQCFRVSNQATFLWNKAREGDAWAINKLLKFDEIAEKSGLYLP